MTGPMASAQQRAELLDVVEEALFRHPAFGDSDYIGRQLETTFLRRLERIAERLPAARELIDAFGQADAGSRRRIASNTVVRCAAYHAHSRLETGEAYGLRLDTCEAVFVATAAHARAGSSGTPFENGSTALERLGRKPHHGWIWNDDYPDDLFGGAFRDLVALEYGTGLTTPDADDIAMLRRSASLLEDLLPGLAPSALGHAQLIACFPDAGFWSGKVSSSQIRMGGTIFLNRKLLRNPWCTAEHLLHESLHQKLYDFRHGHSLLEPDVPEEEKRQICSPWNARELIDANHWDVHRAFAAFHVYVQLALLAEVAERRADELEPAYGPFAGMVESRKALDRARYLGENIAGKCAPQLGHAGGRMLSWLMAILDSIDPAPAPSGATMHLVLDLYEREANRVEQVLETDPAASVALSRDLGPAAESEHEEARRLLEGLHAPDALQELEESILKLPSDDLGRHFPAVRRLIRKAILAASPDGYSLPGGSGEAKVRDFVETGSDRLHLIQANLPAPVAAAKRRARDHRFTKSCDDRVGKLLAVLAATVPPGGRILEIGTGAGVGLGWIVSGLERRDDVHVLSVEGDLKLSSVARSWKWPGWVEILTDDAAAILPDLGAFDLVFADAAPVKYGDPEALVRLLRDGGTLVIDDLARTPRDTPEQLAERARLCTALLHHPELKAIGLDWATNLIVASRLRAKQQPTGEDEPLAPAVTIETVGA